MILKNITFTGADNKTDPKKLYKLSEKHPEIEWGILWYPQKMGQQRYPTKRWIKDFLKNKTDNTHTSLHICGIDAQNFGYKVLESQIWDYISYTDRIQLNFGKMNWNLDAVVAFLQHGKYDFRYAVNLYHAQSPGKYVIIQANKENRILNACLEDESAIEFLFDESRGNGKSIVSLPEPYPLKYNGYAGGISPDNVAAIVKQLNQKYPDFGEYWIDMETGIRTDNEFDLTKVKTVLDKIRSD